MKKALTVIGFIFMLLFSIGSTFKLQHWPGASALLVFSISILITFFLPLFFLDRVLSNKSALNIAVNTFGYFSASLIFTGIMFKVQHWPGASVMLVSGSGLLIFPTLILYVVQQFKEENKKFSEYWKFVFLTFFVSVFFFTYGLNYSRNILYTYLQVEDQVIKNNSSIIKLNNYMISELKISNSETFQKAEKLDLVTKEVYNKIENLKSILVQKACYVSPEMVSDHWKLNGLDNYDIPTYLIGSSESEYGHNLKNTLETYNSDLAKILKAELSAEKRLAEDLKIGINLNLNSNLSYNENSNWQEKMFYLTPLAGTLCLLTSIQNEALNSELNGLMLLKSTSKE